MVSNQHTVVAVIDAQCIVIQPIRGLEQILQIDDHNRHCLIRLSACDVQRTHQNQIVFAILALYNGLKYPRCHQVLLQYFHPILIADVISLQHKVIKPPALTIFRVGHYRIRGRKIEKVCITDTVVDDICRDFPRKHVVIIPWNIIVVIRLTHGINSRCAALLCRDVAQQFDLLIQPDPRHIQLDAIRVFQIVPQHIKISVPGCQKHRQGNNRNQQIGKAPLQKHLCRDPLFLFSHVCILRFFGLASAAGSCYFVTGSLQCSCSFSRNRSPFTGMSTHSPFSQLER